MRKSRDEIECPDEKLEDKEGMVVSLISLSLSREKAVSRRPWERILAFWATRAEP